MGSCRVCRCDSVAGVLPLRTPIHHNYSDFDSSCTLYDFTISSCGNCGFIYADDYVVPKERLYENYTTLSSWKPQRQVELIKRRLEEFVGVKKTSAILEVGANDGSFLKELLQSGYENLLGVEPTQDASAVGRNDLPWIQGFFGSRLLDEYNLREKFDVVISRHVIEHIIEVDEFIEALFDAIAPGGILVLELPDHQAAIEAHDYSFWEEHVNYFSPSHVRFVLQRVGFEIFSRESFLFTGVAQLWLCGKPKHAKSRIRNPGADAVSGFEDQADSSQRYLEAFPTIKAFTQDFVGRRSGNGGVKAYGIGCRLQSIMYQFGLYDFVEALIDDHPQKIGKFAPGSGRKISSSQDIDFTMGSVLLGVNGELEGRVVDQKNISNPISLIGPSRFSCFLGGDRNS